MDLNHNRMKKLLLISLVAMGCDDTESDNMPEGLGIVTSKSTYSFDKIVHCKFSYKCKNGYSNMFDDSCSKYHIGDTINFNH